LRVGGARWKPIASTAVRYSISARAEDGGVLDRLAAMEASLGAQDAHAQGRPIEPCSDILSRTAGKRPVTDDNMGSEWRYFLGLE